MIQEHIQSNTNIGPSAFVISNRNKVLVLLGLLLIGGIVFFAIPGYKVYAALAEARTLDAKGEYAAALEALANVRDLFALPGQVASLTAATAIEESNVSNKKTYNDALEAKENGDLESARKLLVSIPKEYSDYASVSAALVEISDTAASDAKADAQTQTAARKKAEGQAASAAAAKAQAQADAAAAQRAKAESDAAAVAAGVQAQQAAAQRVEEIKKSFKSQLTAAYNTVENEGIYWYTASIKNSNAGNSLLAISAMTSANTAFSSAKNSVSDLNQRFTGLPANYYQATNYLLYAIADLQNAADLLTASEGTTLDYSARINGYKNEAISYLASVSSFLSNN